MLKITQISNTLEKYKLANKVNSSKIKSERAEIVKKFVDKLNSSRIESGYKPLPPAFYAVKMAKAKLSTQDLYWFYRHCEDSKNFSACWWSYLKEK